ncbi:MAG: hypothetical protein M3Y87_14885 [Myxococcota bacterium]|nr:hypothetical protein [Myxococcota bacterium]
MGHRERAPDREGDDDGARASSPDDIFVSFVRRANAEWVASVEALLSEPLAVERGAEAEADEADVEDDDDPEPAAEGTDRIVLLTQKKSFPPPKPPEGDVTVRKSAAEIFASQRRSRRPRPARPRSAAGSAPEEWQSVVPRPSEDTQRREARRIVPDVASVPPPAELPQEGSEDGQIPSAELDRKLADMEVLLRYGHDAQVEGELVALRSAYPGDLLLVRRIAELYIALSLAEPALEALFALATGLFERRNVEGMRQTLEQVLVLDPDNGRAKRLLSLLEQRPSSPPKGQR